MENFVRKYNQKVETDNGKRISEVEKRGTWLNIKRDGIKHMLIIFWLGGTLNFESEGERHMGIINEFLGLEELKGEVFTKMRQRLESDDFWEMRDFTEIVKQLSNNPINFKKLQELLIEDADLDLIDKKEIVLDYLIHRLTQINNQKKSRMRSNFESELMQLIKVSFYQQPESKMKN